eukprot:CAMPEP_0174829096 /NCGR_PEP_ID=MMETSP1114-20130205/1728_1 /TAXON_ID=312471 /ORGANISM="Neobodo designis, Strain CCAP 1951/1" /LENGTH=185 /DNA_ID=CAMNT_0016062839 /DNA_START=41 /DNA_END=594 /DNA_ORIENTATION=-
MLRRTARRLQGFPGGGNFGNMLQQMQQQGGGQRPGGAGCGPGGCGAPTPEMMQQLQAQMGQMMQGGNMGDLMKNMGGGSGGPKIGMMAFGQGENERGKRVNRAAKMVFDTETGKMETDFHEEQIDPDDPMLPKETVENYDTEGAIEVDIVEGELPKHQATEATATPVKEAEIIEEVEVERVDAEP